MVLFIISCAKHKGREQAIKDTWFDQYKGEKYFVRGGHDKVECVTDENSDLYKELDLTAPTLLLPCNDDYMHLHYKMSGVMTYAKSRNVDVLKLDSDVYVNMKNIHMLEGFGEDFVGHHNFGYTKLKAVAGFAYFVPKDALQYLVAYEPEVPNGVCYDEDVTVSRILGENGYPLLHNAEAMNRHAPRFAEALFTLSTYSRTGCEEVIRDLHKQNYPTDDK